MTYALMWYPVAALVVATGIGVWAWSDCGSARDPAVCRETVVPGSLYLLVVILLVGLVVLALVWAIVRALGPVLRRGPTNEEAGWAPHGAGWSDEPAAGDDERAGSAPRSDDATAPVIPSRARRHDRSVP